jgi:hypothetical protein
MNNSEEDVEFWDIEEEMRKCERVGKQSGDGMNT